MVEKLTITTTLFVFQDGMDLGDEDEDDEKVGSPPPLLLLLGSFPADLNRRRRAVSGRHGHPKATRATFSHPPPLFRGRRVSTPLTPPLCPCRRRRGKA